MGWAVVLLPDEHADGQARRVWRAVRDAGFDSALYEQGNRPHVSLTVLMTQDGTLEEKAGRFAAEAAPVTVTFATMGSFGQDVVYLSPQPQGQLLAMNRKLTAGLGALTALADGHYLPGEWQPHLTVAFHIPEGDFRRVHRAARAGFLPFSATFSSIAVVKFNPVKIVGTFELTGN